MCTGLHLLFLNSQINCLGMYLNNLKFDTLRKIYVMFVVSFFLNEIMFEIVPIVWKIKQHYYSNKDSNNNIQQDNA